MLSSRVDGVARNLGYSVGTFADATAALAAVDQDDCRLAFVDLQLPGLDIAAFVQSVRQIKAAEVTIIACGPHVHEQRLRQAQEAGCDRVVTRGQFDRDAQAILQT